MEQPEAPAAPTLDDIRDEGVRLGAAANQAGVALRLLGGVAVWTLCPSARTDPLAREYNDLDFAGRAKARAEIVRFFVANGYVGDRMFNALHGDTRLIFEDPMRGRSIDVILDRFSMCHVIDLAGRLGGDSATIPPAELLLTKLQIVEMNQKDLKDLLALLLDVDLEMPEDGTTVLGRILKLTRDDWGLEHTARRSLERARAASSTFPLEPDQARRIEERIDSVLGALTSASKSLRWQLRARIGERVRWYELPEEARRG